MTSTPVPTTLAEKADPRRAALIVIDMSNDFIHPDGQAARLGHRDLTASRAVVDNIAALAAHARTADVPVIHVQHTTLPGGASASGPWLEARRGATYSAPEICLAGTWGHEIIAELTPQPADTIVRKYRYGGFTGTHLELVLHSLRRDTVICCGISTNVCVETTAREAFSRDFYVVLPSDACASWDMNLHTATLETARQRYATVTTCDDLRQVWTPAAALP